LLGLCNKTVPSRIVQEVFGATPEFLSSKADPLGHVLICIDEAQTFCPNSQYVYKPTELELIKQQQLEKQMWHQFIRDIVRARSNTYILAVTSSYELLTSAPSVESPFDEKVFAAKYFTKSEVEELLALLQRRAKSLVIPKELLNEIIDFIFDEMNGFPGLCGYVLEIIRDMIDEVKRFGPDKFSIYESWKSKKWHLLWNKLLSSRLVRRIEMEAKDTLKEILSFPVLYGSPVKMELSVYSIRVALRCGIFNVVDGFLILSCNVIRSVLLMCSNLTNVRPISSFYQNDELVIRDLLIYLFQHLPLWLLNQQDAWIKSRRTKKLVPSEKIYQFSFYQLLSNICPRDGPILPILEMNREKGKVDLAILTPKGNYQFEFVANVPDTGDFSVESHYVRQVDIYHKADTAQSAVIVLFSLTFTTDPISM